MDVLFWVGLVIFPVVTLLAARLFVGWGHNGAGEDANPPECPHVWGLWSDPDENGRQIRSCGLCNRAERVNPDHRAEYPYWT